MKQTAFTLSKLKTEATIANETPVVGCLTGFTASVVDTSIVLTKEGAFPLGGFHLSVQQNFEGGFSAIGNLSVIRTSDNTASISLLDDSFDNVDFDCNDIPVLYTQF